jgi:hypothetical protein
LRITKRLAWLGGLATAVLGGLIVEWTKDFPVLRACLAIITAAWHWLLAPGSLPHWLILVLVLCTVGLIGLLTLLVLRRADPTRTYTSDSFLEIEWQWVYTGGNIYPDDVVPICPQCRFQMTFMDASNYAAVPRTAVVCEDCGYRRQFEGNHYAVRERVIKSVQRNLRTGNYRLPSAREPK